MCKKCTDEDARQAALDKLIDQKLAEQELDRLGLDWAKHSWLGTFLTREE
jgi:hypothetical protein